MISAFCAYFGPFQKSFDMGKATYKSLCWTNTVGLSVGLSIGRSVSWSCDTLFFFAILCCLKVVKFRYMYFMDVHALAQIIIMRPQDPKKNLT